MEAIYPLKNLETSNVNDEQRKYWMYAFTALELNEETKFAVQATKKYFQELATAHVAQRCSLDKLGDDLRKMCDNGGWEFDQFENEAACILHQMGEKYISIIEMNPQNSRQRMVSIINCCALYVAARKRYKTTLQNPKVEAEVKSRATTGITKILISINKINSTFANSSRSSQKPDIFFTAQQEYTRVLEWRKLTKLKLQKIAKIDVNKSTSDDAKNMRKKKKEKISIILELMAFNQDTYIEIMRRLAAYCLDILGEPPVSLCTSHSVLLQEEIQLRIPISRVQLYLAMAITWKNIFNIFDGIPFCFNSY